MTREEPFSSAILGMRKLRLPTPAATRSSAACLLSLLHLLHLLRVPLTHLLRLLLVLLFYLQRSALSAPASPNCDLACKHGLPQDGKKCTLIFRIREDVHPCAASFFPLSSLCYVPLYSDSVHPETTAPLLERGTHLVLPVGDLLPVPVNSTFSVPQSG